MIAGSYRYLANRKQEKEKKNDERSTGAAGGHRDPHIEFSQKGAIKPNQLNTDLQLLCYLDQRHPIRSWTRNMF